MPKLSSKTGEFESLHTQEAKIVTQCKNVAGMVRRNTSDKLGEASQPLNKASADLVNAVDKFLAAITPPATPAKSDAK